MIVALGGGRYIKKISSTSGSGILTNRLRRPSSKHDSSRIASGEFPAHIRARSLNRRRQNRRENRAGSCNVDFAQSGARQTAQDRRFITVSFVELKAANTAFAAFFASSNPSRSLFCLANRRLRRT